MSPPPLPAPPVTRPEPVVLREVSQWQRTTALGFIYAAIIAGSFFLAYEVRFDFQVAGELEQARAKAEKERTYTTQAENKRLLAEKAKKDAEEAKKEAEKMKFFAAEKERKMALRAERAAEINRIKQEMKQRMIDKQVGATRSNNESTQISEYHVLLFYHFIIISVITFFITF